MLSTNPSKLRQEAGAALRRLLASSVDREVFVRAVEALLEDARLAGIRWSVETIETARKVDERAATVMFMQQYLEGHDAGMADAVGALKVGLPEG